MSCPECEDLRQALTNAFREYETAKARYTESVMECGDRQDVFRERRLLEDTNEAYAKLVVIDSKLTEHRCPS